MCGPHTELEFQRLEATAVCVEADLPRTIKRGFQEVSSKELQQLEQLPKKIGKRAEGQSQHACQV